MRALATLTITTTCTTLCCVCAAMNAAMALGKDRPSKSATNVAPLPQLRASRLLPGIGGGVKPLPLANTRKAKAYAQVHQVRKPKAEDERFVEHAIHVSMRKRSSVAYQQWLDGKSSGNNGTRAALHTPLYAACLWALLLTGSSMPATCGGEVSH